jgi:hypothetical protein
MVITIVEMLPTNLILVLRENVPMVASNVPRQKSAPNAATFAMAITIAATMLMNKTAKTMCVMPVRSDATVVSVLANRNIVTLELCAQMVLRSTNKSHAHQQTVARLNSNVLT